MTAGPDTWGPHGWKFIHFIALGYPNNPTVEDKENYKNFFYLFGDMIPCVICANHYKKNLNKHIIDQYLNSKYDLIKWTINMHNEVNRTSGKKIYSYDEGIKMITNGQQPIDCSNNQVYQVNKSTDYNFILISFLVLIIIVLMLYIYKRNLS